MSEPSHPVSEEALAQRALIEDVWERGIYTCVICPRCAFTFSEDHEDTDRPGRYSCPLCHYDEAAP